MPPCLRGGLSFLPAACCCFIGDKWRKQSERVNLGVTVLLRLFKEKPREAAEVDSPRIQGYTGMTDKVCGETDVLFCPFDPLLPH